MLHIVAIIFIILSLIFALITNHKNHKANPNFPSLLITIGIAFTFFGVALGLQDFDVNDPTKGLSILIDGIKTAFWGSFSGVLGAIILKLHALFWLKEQKADSIYEQQVQEFYHQHKQLTDNSQHFSQIGNIISESNHKLIQAIEHFGINLEEKNQQNTQQLLGSVITSLNGIEHIQRSTQNIIAGEIKELKHEFVEFSLRQAEQNTEIFIKALETAIDRFNESLSNSLGENFKQLNQSVQRLITWQENYAKQIEDQTTNYQKISQDVQRIQGDFEKFIVYGENFNHLTQNIEHTLDSINHQNQEFHTRIEAFYGALDTKIIEMQESRQLLELGLSAIQKQMQSTQLTTEQIFNNIEQYIETAHQNSLESQRINHQQIEQLTQQMQHAFGQSHQQLQESLNMLESKLGQTLNQSLVTLAQQLGSLSTKFAQDYEPITVNLRNIIDSIDQGVR